MRTPDPHTNAPRSRPPSRLRARILPVVGRLAVLLALAQLAAWTVGRWKNDDALWSQFLWWIPSGFTAVCCMLAWAVSRSCEAAATRLAGATLRPFMLLGALACAGWTLASWRPARFLADAATPAQTRATIAYWNAGWYVPRGAVDALRGLDTDVLIVANPRPSDETTALKTFLRDTAVAWRNAHAATIDGRSGHDPGEDAGHAPGPDAPPTLHLAAPRQVTVASRWPILDTGDAPIALDPGSWTAQTASAAQVGVFFVTLDAADDVGRPLTIWIVDLPSDPFTHRHVVMQRALDATRRWHPRGETAPRPFPPPDIIVGDFNTPRGSRSLDVLTQGLTDAYDAVGRGPSATWPAPVPQLAIDLAFTAPAWRATTIDELPMPRGLHKAIVLGIAPAALGDDTTPTAQPAIDPAPEPVTDPATEPASRPANEPPTTPGLSDSD